MTKTTLKFISFLFAKPQKANSFNKFLLQIQSKLRVTEASSKPPIRRFSGFSQYSD